MRTSVAVVHEMVTGLAPLDETEAAHREFGAGDPGRFDPHLLRFLAKG